MSAVFSLSFNVLAEDLSAVDSDTLEKTIALLKSKTQRQDTDDADLDQAYKAAGELLRKMASDSKGSDSKPGSANMMDVLKKAQADPEGFLRNMSPKQQEMIKQLGLKAEDQKK